MALFKAFSGESTRLDLTEKVEGHAYFCTDDGTFYIDYLDKEGNLQRKLINDKYITQLLALQGKVDNFTWDDLKSKPFGEIITEHEPLWEGEVTFTSENDPSTSGSISGINLDPTKSYILKIDDVVQGIFVCTSVDEYNYTETYTNISTDDYNLYITSIREVGEEQAGSIVTVVYVYKYGETEFSAHIVLAEAEIEIKQIEDKYIPDTVVRVADTFETTWNNELIANTSNSLETGDSMSVPLDGQITFEKDKYYTISVRSQYSTYDPSYSEALFQFDGSNLVYVSGDEIDARFSAVYNEVVISGLMSAGTAHEINIYVSTKSLIILDECVPDTIARVSDIPTPVDYTVTCDDTDYEATSNSAAFKRHTLRQLGNPICTIDVPVDLVVKSGSVKEVTEADSPYAGATIGDKYIELVIANQETPIYVPAKDLVDIYTAEPNATIVQLSIDGNNTISATILDNSITEAQLSSDVTTKLSKIEENATAIENRYTKEETDQAISNAIDAWWATIPRAEDVEV